MGNACIMPVLQGDFVNGNFLHSVFAAPIIKDKKDRRGSMEQRYTVTRAAEILHLTQPTLSRQMSQSLKRRWMFFLKTDSVISIPLRFTAGDRTAGKSNGYVLQNTMRI